MLLPFFSGKFERVERPIPELVEIASQHGNSLGTDLVNPARAERPVNHEIGVFEHSQMLRNRRPAYRKLACQLPYSHRRPGELLEDCPASRVAQRVQLMMVSIHLR